MNKNDAIYIHQRFYDKKIMLYTKLSGIIFGIFLMYEFLISENWLKNIMHYDEELQQDVFTFNIGFHFTTIIGIVGVLLLVLCALSLVKSKYSKMLPFALVLALINTSCWEIFWGMSETWYYFEDLNVNLLRRIHCSFQILSIALIITLVIYIICNEMHQKKSKITLTSILSLLLIGMSISDLYLATINNRWFLFQTMIIMTITVILFYMKEEN